MHCFGKKKEQKEKNKSESSSSSDDGLSLSDKTRKKRASLKRNSIEKTRTGGDNFKNAVDDTLGSIAKTVTHYAQQISGSLHRGQGHNNIGNLSPNKKHSEEAKHPDNTNIFKSIEGVDYNELTTSSKRILKPNHKDENKGQKEKEGASHQKKVEQSS